MTPPTDPSRPLRVLAADADPAARAFYRDALTALGHHVCLADSGRQILDLCKAVTPDLVITADRLPDAGGFEVASALCADRPVPVVVAAESPDPGAWAAAGCHVLGHLARPLRADALAAAVTIAVRCFDQLRAAREEAAQLRQALEERKVIERAKGAVVRYCAVGEDEAYRRMRKLATDGGKRMIDVARDVLAAADVFARLADDGIPPSRGAARAPRHDRAHAPAGHVS